MERSWQNILKLKSSAVFSKNRKQRYILWRRFNTGERFLHFIMLNPSEADEQYNDPTITRCINFAKNWNYDGLLITNLFSYCTPYPKDIFQNEKNLSSENKRFIELGLKKSDKTICAWGNHGQIRQRSKKVRPLLSKFPLYCFAVNHNGEPKHPLYVRKDAKLYPFL